MIINETTVKWLEEQQSRLKTRKWFSKIDMPEFGKKFKSPVSVMGQIIFWTTLQESKIPEKLFEKVKMLKSSPQRNFDFHRLMSWIQIIGLSSWKLYQLACLYFWVTAKLFDALSWKFLVWLFWKMGNFSKWIFTFAAAVLTWYRIIHTKSKQFFLF